MISCGTTPIERLALRGCSSMSKPQIVALPPRLGDQAGEDVDQGRLAGAVGAEQAENAAARHVEADPVERALAAGIGLLQVDDRDGGFGHGERNSGTFPSSEAHCPSLRRGPWPRPTRSPPKSPIPKAAASPATAPPRSSPALGHPRVWLQIDEKGYRRLRLLRQALHPEGRAGGRGPTATDPGAG